MKAISIFLMFFIVTNSSANAQIADDVYYKAPKSSSDTGSAVNKIGVYLSLGLGRSSISSLPANVAELDVIGLIASTSVAYNSHVATFTYTGSSSFTGGLETESTYSSSYFAFLLGESLRRKNCLLTLNLGIAQSEIRFTNSMFDRKYEHYSFKGISFPIEFKAFILANEAVGVGFHIYHNIDRKYSTSFMSISIVMGNWNKF